MSDTEPDVDRLLERTLRRSRTLRMRRRVVVVGSATCLVVVLAVTGLWRGSSNDGADVRVGSPTCPTANSDTDDCTTGPSEVTLPPVSASPETVVRTYLAALDHHDTALAKKLLEPGYKARIDSPDSDFTNIVSITDVRITGTSTEYGPWRRPLPEGTTDVITVNTRYDLQQKRALSKSNGDTIWGYTLVRRGPGSRWLITEQGMG